MYSSVKLTFTSILNTNVQIISVKPVGSCAAAGGLRPREFGDRETSAWMSGFIAACIEVCRGVLLGADQQSADGRKSVHAGTHSGCCKDVERSSLRKCSGLREGDGSWPVK